MNFTDAAGRLAGMAGALLGWSPDAFWHATPAELEAVLRALAGDAAPPPPTRHEIAQLMEAFPDG
ncbi:phage tail assembly chaperone [Sphingomonas sp. 32-62-10]|uniref:phage tail assembly chaperone n=1 Tax=Sphingomonas sp. 32-62-10 TaxID=1970436 RepID=UPI000BC3D94C|nr:MAG: hypothetical protein B7Y98_05220 [Sphingomonas sp. 32-62-10]